MTSHLSIKLFGADGEPSKYMNSAEALLVPQLGDSWIGGQCWRVVLYYDLDGGRYFERPLFFEWKLTHPDRMAHLLASHSQSKATHGAFYMDVSLLPTEERNWLQKLNFVLSPEIGAGPV